jgi:hypothetical protein
VDTLNRSYVRNERVVCREVAGETILVSVCGDVAELGSIYVLNPVGAAVWQELESSRSGHELVRRIAEEFDTVQETAEHDVNDFLAELMAVGLIAQTGNAEP